MAMTIPLTAKNLQFSQRAKPAFFFDFDGTLVEFADHPDLVEMSQDIRDGINRIVDAVDGALAIVTGRDICDIDRFFAPSKLSVAGVHGMMRRRGDGVIDRSPINVDAIDTLENRLQQFVVGFPDLLLERKSGSIALHYRARPDLEVACVKEMDKATADIKGLHVLHGKMVVEAKAGDWNKGNAIADFMAEEPFLRRVPVFAGDDLTDEDGFREVNARDGMSIKVGPGKTQAHYRIAGVSALQTWLHDFADMLETANTNATS
jgi:trehalose 6-phosphate phosphatase